MQLFSDPYIWLSVGILLVIIVLMRQLSSRQRYNVQRQRERAAIIKTAQEAEHKNKGLTQTATLQKAKVVQSQTRIPLSDPFGVPFTGAIQGKAAKWEAEIHALGRQIIGQIDSKMAALQAITVDANRTANRLEILVEHLEQIARQQIEWQQNQMVQSQTTQNAEMESMAESNPPAVIPVAATATIPEATPLTEVLKELADDLEGIHKTIRKSTTFSEQAEPATILRLEELQEGTPKADSSSNLRDEVEMLANYGLKPQEIARRLNISLGEADVMLQIQRNRLERTV